MGSERLSADELRALYGAEGIRRRLAAAQAEAVDDPVLSPVFVRVLAILWVLAVAMLATNFIPRHHAPAVLYGAAGKGTTLCTEMQIAAGGTWTCAAWQENSARIPVAQPAAYPGPCTHLRVDQHAGAWTCLSG